MKGSILIDGLRKEDFMTLRWYADVNTVYNKKTKEYVIRNNRGSYVGELVRNDLSNTYKIIYCGNQMIPSLKDLIKLKEVAICILNGSTMPELGSEESEENSFLDLEDYLKMSA